MLFIGVVLSTANHCTFLLFWNNPSSSIETFSELPSVGRPTRAIQVDITQNVKDVINDISDTQFFIHPSYGAATARFYKLGRLNLPIGGHQAIISVSLCLRGVLIAWDERLMRNTIYRTITLRCTYIPRPLILCVQYFLVR